jgi:hypothetical protein
MRKVSIFIFFNFFLFFFFYFTYFIVVVSLGTTSRWFLLSGTAIFCGILRIWKVSIFNFFLLIFSFTYFIYRCCFFSVRNAILLLGTDFRRDSKNAKASIFIFFYFAYFIVVISLGTAQDDFLFQEQWFSAGFQEHERLVFFIFIFFILFIIFFYFTYFIVVDSLVPGQFLLSGTMIFGEERERLIFLFILFFFSFGTTNSNFQWDSIKQ